MTAVLIIFMAFHFDGGVASQSLEFDNMQLCELARKKVVAEAARTAPDEQVDRRRVVATCVYKGKVTHD